MHDFARSSSHHKRQQQKKPQKPSVPKGLIFITLLLLGGLVFGLYKLTNVKLTATITPKTAVKTQTTQSKATPNKKIKPAKDDYDFYIMLPESEVHIPKVEEYSSKKPAATAQQYAYLLQAGSFRSSAEADKLRAKLLLEGLNAKTSRITNSNGSVWHRVMVGPFTSRSKLNKAQDTLAAANTESMVIKVKK